MSGRDRSHTHTHTQTMSDCEHLKECQKCSLYHNQAKATLAQCGFQHLSTVQELEKLKKKVVMLEELLVVKTARLQGLEDAVALSKKAWAHK